MAIAAGPSLNSWCDIEGEVALRHAAKGASLEVKLAGSPLLEQFGLPITLESLREELRSLRLTAVLLLHVLIGSALDNVEHGRLYVTATLDELVAAIGWDPHSTAEREEMRRTIWRWMNLIESLVVIGQRRGRYRDPETRAILDLMSHDALIRIMGQMVPGCPPDPSRPPLEVTFAAGPWIERWQGRRDILSYFGEVRRLAAIPAGKPSGAWAQSIGLAVQQIWRERAHDAVIARVGEENKLTARLRPVTRRQLLTLFPPSPTVHEVLSGPNPKRARTYWDQAIRILRGERLIGHYREIDTLNERREGWAEAWLDQAIDIRAADDDLAAIAEIAGRAGSVTRARRRRRPVRGTRPPSVHGVA